MTKEKTRMKKLTKTMENKMKMKKKVMMMKREEELSRSLTSHEHASGHMRYPCKGHEMFVAPRTEAQHRR